MSAKKVMPTIETMMVEVRVIKIGNKQMTLSVFDQLYEERPFDENWSIIYLMWGKVRRKEGDWVIFQKGNELRKWRIQSSSYLVSDFGFKSDGTFGTHPFFKGEKWNFYSWQSLSKIASALEHDFSPINEKGEELKNAFLRAKEKEDQILGSFHLLPQLFIAV